MEKFLYRPAYKAGRCNTVVSTNIKSFYTDPPTKRVVLSGSSVVSGSVSIQTRLQSGSYIRGQMSQEIEFLYRPAYKAGPTLTTEQLEAIMFLYRPAYKAGPILQGKAIPDVFLYRPAYKAGLVL